MSHMEVMEEREDGDFDIVRINVDREGIETSREILRVLPVAEKEFPNGRPTDDQAQDWHNQRRLEELITSDWTQMADTFANNIRKKAEWAYYRQLLRDLDKTSNWPHVEEEDWPIKPT